MAPRDINAVYKTILLVVSLVLVGLNAFWTFFGDHSGSLIAFIFYSIIAFLCWRMQDYRAGLIAGVIGFGIHLYELVSPGAVDLPAIDLCLLILNLVLPILLIYSGYRIYRSKG